MPRDIITIRRRGGYFSAVDSAAALNFLARTSGLDAAHVLAYKNLLNGLTADGLFNVDGTSSFFDALYIFATQDKPNSGLNLVSSSFTCSTPGTLPSFTADRGYTGVDASSTVYIDTGFNPFTASSPKFVQNSAHVSLWSNTNAASGASGGEALGLDNVSYTQIYPQYSDSKAYFRVNENQTTTSAGITQANSTGHYLGNRSGVSAQQAYKNAVDQGQVGVTSAGVGNGNIYILAGDATGVVTGGSGLQITMASIGGSLTATQVTNFYNRLRTYMTAVGVP